MIICADHLEASALVVCDPMPQVAAAARPAAAPYEGGENRRSREGGAAHTPLQPHLPKVALAPGGVMSTLCPDRRPFESVRQWPLEPSPSHSLARREAFAASAAPSARRRSSRPGGSPGSAPLRERL